MADLVLFPKWKYHKTKPAVVVDDAESEALLGKGWLDAPIDGATPVVEAE